MSKKTPKILLALKFSGVKAPLVYAQKQTSLVYSPAETESMIWPSKSRERYLHVRHRSNRRTDERLHRIGRFDLKKVREDIYTDEITLEIRGVLQGEEE